MSCQEQLAVVEAHTYVAVPKIKITSEPKRKQRRNFVLKKQDGTKNDLCKIFFLTVRYLKNNDRDYIQLLLILQQINVVNTRKHQHLIAIY